MKHKGLWKRVLSMLLIVAMLLPAVPTDVFTMTGRDIKLHFRNDVNWSQVNVYVWDGDGPIKSWPGSSVSKGSDGWYTYTISNYTDSNMNFIYNNGSGAQSPDLYADVAVSQEWWIVPAQKADGTINWVVTDKSLNSPIIDGNKVTFNYVDATAYDVELKGSMNSWGVGYAMSENNDVFSTTIYLDAGKYEYKFHGYKEGGTQEFWTGDPGNVNGNVGNNSVLIISGFAGLMDTVCEKGKSVELPKNLTYYDTSGNPHNTTSVTYELVETSPYASIEGNVLSVSEAYPGGSVALKVTGTSGSKTYTAICKINLTEKYTIYAHSAVEDRNSINAASLHIWDGSGETTLKSADYIFQTTEVLADGRTWLKIETQLPAAKELGIILKSKGENVWTWQTKDLTYADRVGVENTLYVLDGYTEVFTNLEKAPEDKYLYIEYTRADNNYSNTWAYVWNNGWTHMVNGIEEWLQWPFEKVNGEYIAKVPVAMGDTDKTIGFIVKKGTDWEGKDGGDNFILMPANQDSVKVRFEGGGITYRLPVNVGSELNRKDELLHFYYRDKELFEKNSLETLGKVEVVVGTMSEEGTLTEKTYEMTYNAKEERYAHSIPLLEETDYYYYYRVNGQKVLDIWNKRKVEVNGEEYSLRRNRFYPVELHA